MDWLKEFLDQVGKIPSVWMPFVVVLAILSAAIWQYLSHYYSGRLASADDRLKLRDDRIADYERKAGSTPDEAQARIEALEREIEKLRPRQRSLTAAQKQTITDAVHHVAVAKHQFDIIYPDSASEAALYAEDFAEALREAGWVVAASIMLGRQRWRYKGVTLAVRSLAQKSDEALALGTGLEAAKVPFEWVEMSGLQHDRLFVDMIED